MTRSYHVYILTNDSGTLYVGVTNDIERRVGEHRMRTVPGFTTKYRLKRLVYCEETQDVHEALAVRNKSRSGGGRRRSPSSTL